MKSKNARRKKFLKEHPEHTEREIIDKASDGNEKWRQLLKEDRKWKRYGRYYRE